MDQILLKSCLISPIPDNINEVNDTRFNDNLALS